MIYNLEQNMKTIFLSNGSLKRFSLGVTGLLANVISNSVAIPVIPVVENVVSIVVSQEGQTLLSVPVIWFIWCPVNPIDGCVQMLPCPFSRVMLVVLCVR